METYIIPRRIYAPEARALLGWSDTWLRAKIAAGTIPPPRCDPGSKRPFWPSDEFAGIVERVNALAPRVAMRAPAVVRERQARRSTAQPAPVRGRTTRRDARVA